MYHDFLCGTKFKKKKKYQNMLVIQSDVKYLIVCNQNKLFHVSPQISFANELKSDFGLIKITLKSTYIFKYLGKSTSGVLFLSHGCQKTLTCVSFLYTRGRSLH